MDCRTAERSVGRPSSEASVFGSVAAVPGSVEVTAT